MPINPQRVLLVNLLMQPILCKESANYRKESVLSMYGVLSVLCKDNNDDER